MTRKRIFISVANREHEVLRADLRDSLTRAGFDVVVQPDFPHTTTDTLRKLDNLIAPCDLVLHIVGSDPGSNVSSAAVADFIRDNSRGEFLGSLPEVRTRIDISQLTYFQWEPWLALNRQIDVLVYGIEGHMEPTFSQRKHLDSLQFIRKHAETLKDEARRCGQIVADMCVHFGIVPGDRRSIAPSRLTRHAARNFFGRERELELLDQAWQDPDTHIVSIVAWGGVGKTALVTQWIATSMVARHWPGVERYFDWSFYSQGTGDSRQTSSDLFINTALTDFGDPDPVKGSSWERGERLAQLVREHKTLLVLDGIEPLQYPPTDRSGQAGRLKDQALEALLQSLVQDNNGLCIVTTREHLANIDSYPTQQEHKLGKLTLEAAISLIRHLQLNGRDEEIKEMWDALDGHALAMLQLGRLLARGYGKDLRRWREIGFTQADKLGQGRSTMKVMAQYEAWLANGNNEQQLELAILRLLGLFDRPMSPGCFGALRASPSIEGLTDLFAGLEQFEVAAAVTTLIENELLSHGGGEAWSGSPLDVTIDAHPLIREYFAVQLKQKQPAAFQAAHSRLFAHLCKTTPYRPDGLQGLAPLYEAVTHGCLAGRHQEALSKVYDDRILRGTGHNGFYSTDKLGAIGADLVAVAAFFDKPWNQVSLNLREVDQAWFLNEAATRLCALGRLTEALEPMRAGLEMRVKGNDWVNAARTSSNLSELEITLGQLPDAVTDARQSITLADQGGVAFVCMVNRSTAANALHQSGQRAEAGALFAEAERMQQKMQPQFDLLYSVQGFRYCDWLLVPAEQSASKHLLSQPLSNSKSQVSASLAEVKRRATCTLKWMIEKEMSRLSVALDHLTLARVRLTQAILSVCSSNGRGVLPDGSLGGIEQNSNGQEGSSSDDSAGLLANLLPQPTLELPQVAAALDGLRAAGHLDYLPRGLLTASMYYFLRGDHNLARNHLAEAEQIADRGSMRLFLADIYLTRARFGASVIGEGGKWRVDAKSELAKAAKLIRNLGYGGRYEELEDAEAALGKC